MSEEARSNCNFSVVAQLREQELLYVVKNAFLAFIEQISAMYGGDHGLADDSCGNLSGKKSEKSVRVNDVVRYFTVFANNRAGDRENG